MTHIALDEAQQQFADLIAAVGRGEEFVITVEGSPAAIVTAPKQPGEKPRPKFGSARGKFEMADDFDAPLDDFAEYM
ncbi:MAG: type II toxin-antitoxin system prevent-host-death family antitoxin [Pirellulales bacterium]|nr:type II toxin-antitoxin system prevent-host-death family antitoxin [Pirellulales bacterium]